MRKEKYYEVKRPETQEYWELKDLKKLLSYGGDITVAQSPRNFGKSYACMQLAKEEIEKGNNVAWGRYNRAELGQAIQTFQGMFPNYRLVKKGDGGFTWFINDETDGSILFFTWNRSQNMKGIDFKFSYMICDEFVPERYTEKPRLDTEFGDWTSVYKSISRSFGTKVIMISNNIYWFNPFFLSWEITPFDKGQILKVTDSYNITYENEDFKTERVFVMENVSATKAILKRNLKQQALEFSSEADMEKYFENVTKKEYTRIGECPDMSVQPENYQLSATGFTMGIRNYQNEKYFFKTKHRDDIPTYVAEPEYISMKTRDYRDSDIAVLFEDAFNTGRCIFESGECLLAFLRWVRLTKQRL